MAPVKPGPASRLPLHSLLAAIPHTQIHTSVSNTLISPTLLPPLSPLLILCLPGWSPSPLTTGTGSASLW